MNKKLLTIAFVLLACVSFTQSNYHTPYDPGAARNTLSNVTPATGRAALELGTMAVATATDYVATSSLAARVDTINASFTGDIDVTGDVGAATINGMTPGTMVGEAKNDYVATDTFTDHADAVGTAVHGLGTMAVATATDYVATDTFTGHTGATGASVHGLGTISTKADTDYVATSSLAARVDTVNASFTGDIDVTGDVGAATLGVTGHATLNTASATKIQSAAYDTADGDLLDMMAMINGYNPKRWGIRITKAETNPATRVTYLYDAVGMDPVTMDFASNTINYGDWKPFCDAMNRPVMLDAAGNVVEVLDPDDQTKKIDGTASSISSTTHALNAMSEFKRLWLRTYEDETYQYIIFSNVQYDENYHANAFTSADGTVRDRMYYAMYEGSDVSSKLRSLATGAMMANRTAATEITYAEANGAGWHINYKSQRDFITYLLALISKSTNSQAVFGQGNASSTAYIAPGALKDKGRFWGDDDTDQAVKVFFIEHFWGNYWKRCSGLLYNDAKHILVKATPPYSMTGVEYTDTGITPTGTSGQFITAGTLTDAGFLPITAGGSDSMYFADGLYYATPVTGVFNVALVGGARDGAGRCGSWACFLNSAGDAHAYVGASLSFLKP